VYDEIRMRNDPANAPSRGDPTLTVEELAAQPTLDAALDRVAAARDFSRHPYFVWLVSEAATREQFRRTQVPFRFAVEEFPHALAAVLARISDSSQRTAIAENVAEEHGRGNELASHKATFLQYLRALGAADDELDAPCPATVAAFNQALLGFCLANPAEAGAAATGVIEHLYIWISGTIARLVRDRGWCAPGSQRHYEVHELLDQTHARDLLAVARPGWRDPVTRAQVALGLAVGAEWFWTLYRDLHECLR
jgi:pyrroloquinoline-quinone synthase